jgi:hypothetical protein
MTPDAETNIFQRLGAIENDTSAIKAMLSERCEAREKTLDDFELRIRKLEAAEHKRKGGMAVLAVLMGLASAAGAAAMRLLGN